MYQNPKMLDYPTYKIANVTLNGQAIKYERIDDRTIKTTKSEFLRLAGKDVNEMVVRV